jgi:peptidoglycan/xylan/chitin deacetylase (PgdA/CDA1 family)
MIAGGTLPVLCYHRVGGPLELGVTRVSARAFERQMRALAARGWRTVTLSQFEERLRGGVPPAPNEFLLSFDDGYASLGQYAYPLLSDLGFIATTFLITDYVGRENVWDARYTMNPLPHLDWPEIEHWRSRGFEFGSHGAAHLRLTWLSETAALEELQRSRTILCTTLGEEAGRAIAYPFGACDNRIRRLAARAGYRMGFGGVRANGDALLLPRVPVYAWDRGLPFGLRRDWIGRVGKTAAHVANRASVGTSIFLAMRGSARHFSG